jgi:hypothetical protein
MLKEGGKSIESNYVEHPINNINFSLYKGQIKVEFIAAFLL